MSPEFVSTAPVDAGADRGMTTQLQDTIATAFATR